MAEIKYGWFSAKQKAEGGGTFIYCTPACREVECSEINSDSNKSMMNWDDIVCIGEVREFVRDGQRDSRFIRDPR